MNNEKAKGILNTLCSSRIRVDKGEMPIANLSLLFCLIAALCAPHLALGSVIAEPVLRLLRITEPVARGVAIGTSSHAIGTTKAMELGRIEGAMSSLSIVVSGILTVFGAYIFSFFL